MEVKPDQMQKYGAGGKTGPLEQLNSELTAYWPPVAFVARGFSFDMEQVINRARRNYFGIFEERQDPVSKDDKTWPPLTEATVETIVKTVDVDTKDIHILPRKPQDTMGAKILRPLAKFLLDKLDFGQVLNDLIRTMVIDGTVILKSYKGYTRDFKEKITKVKIVDTLNFYIDPTADYSQDSNSVIERVIMYPDELKRYKSWKNTNIEGGKIDKTPDTSTSGDANVKQIAVYERWGRICRAWLKEFNGETPTVEDFNDWFEGVVISSGTSVSNPQATIIHYIGENTHPKKLRPYEEGWYRRMANRWHGRGVPEQLFGMQEYLNTIFNIRKNNAKVLQNGLFLIRKGSGITPQMVSSLGAGGGIPVTGLETDIKQLPVQDVRNSSYKDEDVAQGWARGVSMGFNSPSEVAPSAPATLGVINQQNTRDVFDLIQEGIGLMLKRLLQNHLLPSFLEDLTPGEIIRITGDRKSLEELDEIYIDMKVNEAALKYLDANGFWPAPEEIEREKAGFRKELEKLGNSRFIEFKKSFFDFEYDVEVVVGGESLNKALIAQQLRDMVISYSRIPGVAIDVEKVFQEWMYLLGLNVDLYKPAQQQAQLPAEGAYQQQNLTQIGQPNITPRLLQEFSAKPPTPVNQNVTANRLNAGGLKGR